MPRQSAELKEVQPQAKIRETLETYIHMKMNACQRPQIRNGRNL
jgi:hypothetical protein